MGVIFSTHDLNRSERFDYWHEVVYRTYAPCVGKVDSTTDFQASVGVSNFGAAQITEVRSSGISYERRAFDVRTGPREDFYAVAMLSGRTMVTQDGRDIVAEAGDVYLYNSAKPYSHRSESNYHCLSMRIPLPILHSRLLNVDELSGSVLRSGTPYGRMVSSLIKEAAEISSSDGITDMLEFSGPVIDMISAAMNRATTEAVPSSSRNQNLLVRIQRYMRENLDDSTLTLASISKEQNVSVRTLARLFGDIDATPMGWLQNQRLARAYADLAERRALSVTEAAFAVGFNDLSHFGRVFKKCYGHTPHTLLGVRSN
ncbi:helix-turn-helix domain-containing protein [Rhizobium sp. Root1204]|uniref:helix-turn-helix domain-containing protein n=1 Tax=Rhizobium sp. Root1204 TaxID=1736428 RepID=UPI000A49CD74|nr:helix-turn-helix domain-containing protein [Rhizobium sp. Root1204]